MEKGAASAPAVPFWRSTRKMLHAITFGFVFCFTVTELGLVSQQIHKYGKYDENYPTKEYKHDIGLLLFNSIFTLLFLIGHPFANLGINAIFSLIIAVFWGTGAGVLYQVTPFKGTRCGNAIESFPAAWQPYTAQCSRIVTIEAFAWMQWAIFVVLFFSFFIQMYEFKRSNRVTVYGA